MSTVEEAPTMFRRNAIHASFDALTWWTQPALAYGKGLHDGFHEGYLAGRAAVDAELVAALAEALGGPGCHDYREAVRRHHHALDAKARRAAADAGHHITRSAA